VTLDEVVSDFFQALPRKNGILSSHVLYGRSPHDQAMNKKATIHGRATKKRKDEAKRKQSRRRL
jgi:hypothetical protein